MSTILYLCHELHLIALFIDIKYLVMKEHKVVIPDWKLKKMIFFYVIFEPGYLSQKCFLTFEILTASRNDLKLREPCLRMCTEYAGLEITDDSAVALRT